MRNAILQQRFERKRFEVIGGAGERNGRRKMPRCYVKRLTCSGISTTTGWMGFVLGARFSDVLGGYVHCYDGNNRDTQGCVKNHEHPFTHHDF